MRARIYRLGRIYSSDFAFTAALLLAVGLFGTVAGLSSSVLV